jgi:hypothetical protein
MYSKEEIQVIHQQALAKFNRRYASLDGETFVGTKSGRLKIVSEEVLELERALDIVEAEISEVTEVTPVVEETSYFAIDADGDLTPLPVIPSILTDNLFTLDLVTGDLTPNNIGINDIFFRLLGDELTPKVL